MPKSLGATICIRNGIAYDFCFVECIESLLPICDEIIVAYQVGTDDTRDVLDQISSRNPKIKIHTYDQHLNPSHYGDYVMDWTNWARERLKTEYHIQLDADEVLHEDSYGFIWDHMQAAESREASVRVQRWNFWEDAQHMIPFGEVCGHEVIRIGPTRLWMPADVPHPKGQAMMNMERIDLRIKIHHYGFLRKPEAFFAKEKFLQTAFTGGYDKQFDALEAKRDWMNKLQASWKTRPLEKYNGSHPKVIHRWLYDRGYTP